MTSRPVGQEGHCFLVVAFLFVGGLLFEVIKFSKTDRSKGQSFCLLSSTHGPIVYS